MSEETKEVEVVAHATAVPAKKDAPAAEVAPYNNLNLERDTETDYDFVRKNLKAVVKDGTVALQDMIALAQQMDHPRAFEVVSQLVKSVTESTTQLIELQKNMQELTQTDTPTRGGKAVNNIAFFGSTHDLQKLIAGKTDITDIPVISDDDES